MYTSYKTPTWYKQWPVLKILIPLSMGILTGWYYELPIITLICFLCFDILFISIYSSFPASLRYKTTVLQGILFQLLFFLAGMVLVYISNPMHQKDYLYNNYKQQPILVRIEENPVEKAKTYKIKASCISLFEEDGPKQVKGNLILYFPKSDSILLLSTGKMLLIKTPLQTIKNAGNPGSFNYAAYSLFRGISYQAFLKEGSYRIIATTTEKQVYLFNTLKEKALAVLRKNIQQKEALAVAEALLLGYREDLDKELVQAYSNTGVVHIIAISGLHLGMIYALFNWLLGFFGKNNAFARWGKPLIIIAILWVFTLIAGAAPSILRSAVMFSFIVAGDMFNKKTNGINALACSALVLLIFNPFILWDVGFQLSYAAVLSIMVFQQRIYNLLHFNNKLLSGFWRLNSITISAQIITTPIVLYHFHQFPNLFLLTNLLAVPLSGFILYAEILLLIFFALAPLNSWLGKLIEVSINFLNNFIKQVNELPFAVTNQIQISLPEVLLLLITIAFIANWLFRKQKKYLFVGMGSFFLFNLVHTSNILWMKSKTRLIVYSIPKYSAIDIAYNGDYYFKGDEELETDGFLRNFHIQPTRTLYRLSPAKAKLDFLKKGNIIPIENKKIIVIDKATVLPQNDSLTADIVIITNNPSIRMDELKKKINCSLYIFDESNPWWKIEYWKKDCNRLHLRHHSTAEKGAFEMVF